MTGPVQVSFAAGAHGIWRIDAIRSVRGDPLTPAERLAVREGQPERDNGAAWQLNGVTSNLRYTQREERDRLADNQQGLSRPTSTRAVLIPICKSEAWWALAQDERRIIMEERSHHIAIGMDYLPAVARRLHHSRDLGEPFDFLTWFEFAPEAETAFNAMLDRLRATEEWGYVTREVEIRLSR
jgi:chlorite dismutase